MANAVTANKIRDEAVLRRVYCKRTATIQPIARIPSCKLSEPDEKLWLGTYAATVAANATYTPTASSASRSCVMLAVTVAKAVAITSMKAIEPDWLKKILGNARKGDPKPASANKTDPAIIVGKPIKASMNSSFDDSSFFLS